MLSNKFRIFVISGLIFIGQFVKTMSSSNIKNILKLHYKCRGLLYPRSNDVKRFEVPDDKVPWSVKWTEYTPVNYTSEKIIGQSWADPNVEDPNFVPKWNELDELINRKSFMGNYEVYDNYPLNPIGRTGIVGRGCLGRWGPNHAADPIVTRWKRNENNEVQIHDISGKSILQFVGIQRRDSGEWALPGGMVDPGEVVTTTLKREFMEEALNVLMSDSDDKKEKEMLVNNFFQNGIDVYKGYVDDPRNTDNAWMETVALNFHDEDGNSVGMFPLTAGDDAVNVRWIDVDSKLKLYASHIDFLAIVANKHNAHW